MTTPGDKTDTPWPGLAWLGLGGGLFPLFFSGSLKKKLLRRRAAIWQLFGSPHRSKASFNKNLKQIFVTCKCKTNCELQSNHILQVTVNRHCLLISNESRVSQCFHRCTGGNPARATDQTDPLQAFVSLFFCREIFGTSVGGGDGEGEGDGATKGRRG